MKMILEGSSADIKEVLSTADLQFESAKNLFKSENFEKVAKNFQTRATELVEKATSDHKSLIEKIETLQKERNNLVALCEKASANEELIKSLKEENQRLSEELSHPVRLSPEQEAQIEALFQEQMKDCISPPVFQHPTEKNVQITALQVLDTVFGLLASGNRVKSMRAIREITGANLSVCKKMVDNALIAYGCDISGSNTPQPVQNEVIEKPVLPKRNRN